MASELYSNSPPITAPTRLEANAKSGFGVRLYELAKINAAKKIGDAIRTIATSNRTTSPVRSNMWTGKKKLIAIAAASRA